MSKIYGYLIKHVDLESTIFFHAIQSLKNFNSTAAYGIARNDIVAEVNVIMDLLSGRTPLKSNGDAGTPTKRSEFAESFYWKNLNSNT